MYDWKAAMESSIAYWETQPTDQPWLVNGFAGTWNITDHKLIPNELCNFLSESFYSYARFTRIPLEDINNLLNEVWDGPGSMSKIIRLTHEKKQARQSLDLDTKDALKGYDTPTVDSNLAAVEVKIDAD